MHQTMMRACRRTNAFGVGKRWLSDGRDLGAVHVFKQDSVNSKALLVTCEHAGNDLPPGVAWGPSDSARSLSSQHWAYDPGAREFSLELAKALDCPAVLSRYSRLFVDLNRPVASPTLCRPLCDGEKVDLNEGLESEQRVERISKFYLPYHEQVETSALSSGARTAISVHTYTASYEGTPRDFEIGVLYSTNNEELAERVARALVERGFTARVNEPWSGKHGFMFSADCFAYNGAPGDRDALMLEFRNDVCIQPEWRERVISVLAPLLLSR